MAKPLIDAQDLHASLDDSKLVLIDLCKDELYPQAHIPGAIHMNYAEVVRQNPPVMGLLPDEQAFSEVLGKHGISPDSWVVAYDDEGGGKAGRLLWTLEAAGHRNCTLLNGGIHAWQAAGLPFTTEVPAVTPATYPVKFTDNVVARRDYILTNLNKPGIKIMDCRSAGEYAGSDVRAARGGHIPGAVNLDWMDIMDKDRALQLKANDWLENKLAELGLSRDDEIIVYCHTHHRSALNFIMLKSLGFEKVKGYPGSWSDWGNQPDTPIE